MGVMSRRRSLLVRKRLNKTVAVLGARFPETRVVTGSTRTSGIVRLPVALAGKFKRLRFRFDNWYFGGDGEFISTGNPLTITKATFEMSGVAVSVPFGGLRSVTLPIVTTAEDAKKGVWSDWVRPYGFSLSRFQTALESTTAHGYRRYQGLRCFFRGSVSVASGGKIPIGPIGLDSDSLGMFAVYDPANHIEQVDLTGTMTVPTGALTIMDYTADDKASEPNNMAWGPSEIIGETFDGRQLTIFAEGPSTWSGREWLRNPATQKVSWGVVGAAMQSADNSLGYVIPCGFATKSGGKVAYRSQNVAIDAARKHANHQLCFTGQNDIASGGGSTPKVLVDDHIPRIVSKARAAGIRHCLDCMPLPRTTTTDGGATYANQTESSPSGDHAAGDYLRRRMGRATAQGVLDLTLGLPSMTSSLTPYRWNTNGAADWLALDESGSILHPTKTGAEAIAGEIRWALTTGLGMPRVSRNFAAACTVKPSAAMLNKLEVFRASHLASGFNYQMFWNLNWPLVGGGDEQTRLVNCIWPGVWNLYPTDAGGVITYAADGTQCDGSTSFMRLFLDPSEDFNPGLAPELSPVLVDSITLVLKTSAHDGLAIWGNPSGSSSSENLSMNPRNSSGNFSMRLNDLTNYDRAVASGNGVSIGTRNGLRRQAWVNGTALAADASDVPTTGYSSAGLLLYRSIVNTDFTTTKLQAAGIAAGCTEAQALTETTNINIFTA